MMKMMIMITMVMMIMIIVIMIIVHPYFQQNCEMVVVASFSCSVRLILILPTTKLSLLCGTIIESRN